MDGGEQNVGIVRESFVDYVADRRLVVDRAFITRENIDFAHLLHRLYGRSRFSQYRP